MGTKKQARLPSPSPPPHELTQAQRKLSLIALSNSLPTDSLTFLSTPQRNSLAFDLKLLSRPQPHSPNAQYPQL